MRGQTELVALGVAFVLLTGTVAAGVVLANSALTSAERDALERQTATALSERLVSVDANHTVRENVFANETVDSLNETTLREEYNVPTDADISVSLGSEQIIETGPVTDGTTIERIVLVERQTVEQLHPDFDNSRSVSLPRRTSNVRLTLDPPAGTTVEYVYANDRIVLANGSGLVGTFNVSISSYETTTLRFEAAGILDEGSATVEYRPPETVKATLRVSVDA